MQVIEHATRRTHSARQVAAGDGWRVQKDFGQIDQRRVWAAWSRQRVTSATVVAAAYLLVFMGISGSPMFTHGKVGRTQRCCFRLGGIGSARFGLFQDL